MKGYLALVLHAHLPFIRHPEYPDFLEEDWFFEATVETYLPLLDAYERLHADGIDFRVTMSLTPPLCAMMSDELLTDRFRHYLNQRIELSAKELARTKDTEFFYVAQMYNRKFARYRDLFELPYRGNILNGFKKFQQMGKLEIITCCATHGYLPLMPHWESRRAQIKIAAEDYRRKFDCDPRGIWLAECAYNPGDDAFLREQGIRFFFMESHGLMHASPRPKYGVYAPVYTPQGVAAFARDMESAQQVWNAQTGYPGDPRYREFYRDLGYDLDYDYVKPYLHSDGVRRNIGMKYHKITGKTPLNSKQPYYPSHAAAMAAEHAGNFMFNRQKQLEHLATVITDRKPLVVSMYDAELYGHWWYEGVDFLEMLFRKIHCDQNALKLITPAEYLNEYPVNQVARPSMSSWGDKGYHYVWLNGRNDWIYGHLIKASERMIGLANKFPRAEGVLKRALNQAARELLLMQSSDWAFLMSAGTAKEYSAKRTKDHILRFNALRDMIVYNRIDESYVWDLEKKDNIFPEIDYNVYSGK
jgi:1,4-alpha-glucan branching enzyme